jgi:hypothetical protein
MSNSETLISAARILLAEAAKLTPPASAPHLWYGIDLDALPVSDSVDPHAPHEYVAFAPGVLPEQAGIGGNPPRSYDTHRLLWKAAQRERWPNPEGKPYILFDYMQKGWDAVHDSIVFLWTSPAGMRWRLDPANAGYVPKHAPEK